MGRAVKIISNRSKPSELRHPFLDKLTGHRRQLTFDWMKMLSERKDLSRLLVPIEETQERSEIRKKVRKSFNRFITKPSRYRLSAFFDLATINSDFGRCLFNQAMTLRIAKRPSKKTSDNMHFFQHSLGGLLADNGICIGRFKGAFFLSDIIASAKIPNYNYPVFYLIDRSTIQYYTMPDDKFEMPPIVGGWAESLTLKCYLIPHDREFIELVIQHEAQHLLDFLLDIPFENPEYTAYLAEYAFCKDGLQKGRCFNEFGGTDKEKPHDAAKWRIYKELSERGVEVWDFYGDHLKCVPRENVQSNARALLNKAYLEKTGLTYDKLIGLAHE